MWKVFNRTAIVVWKAEQAGLARRLLGPRADDPGEVRDLALAAARTDIDANPQDKFAWFNAGSTLVQMGEFSRAARAFDTARGLRLPWRMLWYQFGPLRGLFRRARVCHPGPARDPDPVDDKRAGGEPFVARAGLPRRWGRRSTRKPNLKRR